MEGGFWAASVGAFVLQVARMFFSPLLFFPLPALPAAVRTRVSLCSDETAREPDPLMSKLARARSMQKEDSVAEPWLR